MRVGIPIADLTAGIFLAQGILVALLERERSGKGQWVHTSLLQAHGRHARLPGRALAHRRARSRRRPATTIRPAIPTGVFKTADGHLNIAASGQHMFSASARRSAPSAARRPALPHRAGPLEEPQGADAASSRRASQAHHPGVGRGAQRQGASRAGPILDVKQVFENEQIRHLDGGAGQAPGARRAARAGPAGHALAHPGRVRTPAPDAGEHNDQILTELGYSPSDIDTLRNDKVI